MAKKLGCSGSQQVNQKYTVDLVAFLKVRDGAGATFPARGSVQSSEKPAAPHCPRWPALRPHGLQYWKGKQSQTRAGPEGVLRRLAPIVPHLSRKPPTSCLRREPGPGTDGNKPSIVLSVSWDGAILCLLSPSGHRRESGTMARDMMWGVKHDGVWCSCKPIKGRVVWWSTVTVTTS